MNVYQTKFDHPLISVIVPAYNAEPFIEKTLNSILSQTYKNIEVLVVDDGSQDRTAEIINSVAQKDHRVVLLQQPNAGVASARNLGIQASQGEFIAPIDADDIWFPQNLEKLLLCLLEADPAVGLVYAWSVDVDEHDIPTGKFRASTIEGKVYMTLVCHNFLGNASASLIRRTCFDKLGGYNCKLKEQNATGCEDWELYLRIAESYQFRVVPEFLVGYRKLSGTMSCDYGAMAQSHELMLQSVQQAHPEMPRAIYQLSKSSFYLYLARQSHQLGSDRTTLLWLYKAWRADFITPLLRYGFYTLAIKSLSSLIAQPVAPMLGLKYPLQIPFNRWLAFQQRVLTTSDLTQQRASIHFKVLVGSTFHRLIPILIATRKPLKAS